MDTNEHESSAGENLFASIRVYSRLKTKKINRERRKGREGREK
jgi:hypothetical protein